MPCPGRAAPTLQYAGMRRESLHDTGTQSVNAENCVAEVGALAPRIAAAADDIERRRRIPDDLLDALHAAGLYRMLLPRRYGGGEVHPLTFMRSVQAIARADASTAWNIGQNAVCAIVAAYLEPAVAQDVFGDPRAVLAWGPADGPVRAVACDGGYRVSGRWSFASGMRHATWLGALCPIVEADGSPRRSDDGRARKRVMLIPASRATHLGRLERHRTARHGERRLRHRRRVRAAGLQRLSRHGGGEPRAGLVVLFFDPQSVFLRLRQHRARRGARDARCLRRARVEQDAARHARRRCATMRSCRRASRARTPRSNRQRPT